MTKTYREAGVDVERGDAFAAFIAGLRSPAVLSSIGSFAGAMELDTAGMERPLLLTTTDGVGTKILVGRALGRYDTLGIDLVAMNVNDLLVCGARPLGFLDYIACGRIDEEVLHPIITGVVRGCELARCTLTGGETAEMPGLYSGEDFDLVGFIIGVVEKDAVLNGSAIKPGDVVLGLPSNGLHTNGYSLVRRIFGESREVLITHYPELGRTLGEALLVPHHSYYREVKPLLPLVKGLAHITGGGLLDNVPRVLPGGVAARFDSKLWTVPPIFRLIQERGKVGSSEMYRVFNMGIGMTIFVSPDTVASITQALPEARIIGEAVKQSGEARVLIV